MLIDEIKKENIQAMKDKDSIKRAILSVVITKYNNLAIELKGKGKEITDADLITVIQKTVKELEEERVNWDKVGNGQKVKEIDHQFACIYPYLPKQLTEKEIKEIIDSLVDKSIPGVMKHFKLYHAGQVDMSLVSKIARGE